jgi:hypothetical protein
MAAFCIGENLISCHTGWSWRRWSSVLWGIQENGSRLQQTWREITEKCKEDSKLWKFENVAAANIFMNIGHGKNERKRSTTSEGYWEARARGQTSRSRLKRQMNGIRGKSNTSNLAVKSFCTDKMEITACLKLGVWTRFLGPHVPTCSSRPRGAVTRRWGHAMAEKPVRDGPRHISDSCWIQSLKAFPPECFRQMVHWPAS